MADHGYFELVDRHGAYHAVIEDKELALLDISQDSPCEQAKLEVEYAHSELERFVITENFNDSRIRAFGLLLLAIPLNFAFPLLERRIYKKLNTLDYHEESVTLIP